MPFSGPTYTPPLGAQNAAPGTVIRSSVWNTIFTDLATALTTLANASYLNQRTVAAGSFTVTAGDNLILVGGSSPSIFLPTCASKLGPVTIVGAASTVFGSNNAVLIPSGTEKIGGASLVTLSANWDVKILVPLGSGVGYAIK